MPAKKTSATKKPGRGKKPVGLTSALGPKATTILVICVMAGGIAFAARQKDQAAKAKAAEEAVMSADVSAAPTPAATPKKPAARPKAETSTAIADAGARPTSTAAASKSDATITGCLERDGDGFRLKNTEGEDAPKSRSWKSGFLKKGSSSIEVIDPSRTLRLASQVGRRVTVSGTLTNRELRATAVHQIAPSCKGK